MILYNCTLILSTYIYDLSYRVQLTIFLLFKDNLKLNLSDQSKEILENKIALRKSLSQILPADVVEYIMKLIVKDQAHQKLLEILKEN